MRPKPLTAPPAAASAPGSAVRFREPWEPSSAALGAMGLLVISGGAIALAVAAGPWLEPGRPATYALGWLAALAMLAPVAFAAAKRSGRARRPRAWFALHAWAGALAVPLAALHSGGGMSVMPLGLLALLPLVSAQGVAWRLVSGPALARRMGSRAAAFAPPDPDLRGTLTALLADKRALLARIAPGADEAAFAPAPRHWLTHPLATLRYRRLARREARLLGGAGTPPATRPRRWHIALAALLLGGLAAHVLTVSLFAGYVAGDGPVTWPHLAEWGRGWSWRGLVP